MMVIFCNEKYKVCLADKLPQGKCIHIIYSGNTMDMELIEKLLNDAYNHGVRVGDSNSNDNDW